MERVYKTMRGAGAAGITLGIITMVTGLVCGILMIVYGGVLLKRKAEITF